MRAFHENDFSAIVREIAGDLVESMTLLDEFKNPKTERISRCYRIVYRSPDRTLTNQEINALHENVRHAIVSELGLELR